MNIDELYAIRVYEKALGPLKTVTMLSIEEAMEASMGFYGDYETTKNSTIVRFALEDIIKSTFELKGHKARNNYAIYFFIGNEPMPELIHSFKEYEYIKVPLKDFDTSAISFTYNDSYDSMFSKQQKRKRKVYTFEELEELITYWEQDEFREPIEMQLWDERCLKDYTKYVQK